VAPTDRIAFLPGAAGDRALATRMVAGEELAFRECYELHAAKVFRTLLRVVGERGRAEDVLQESFAAAFDGIAEFRAEARLGTWITGIAIRRALNLRRYEARRLQVALEPAQHEPAAPGPGPEAELQSRDLARRVLLLVEDLDPPRRAALLLHAEGHTVTEIAEMTGMPRGTVLSHIARARARLLEQLDALDGVDEDERQAEADRKEGSRG
jgi:RNA polymerase sigma-70 factor (ECF subfamily)